MSLTPEFLQGLGDLLNRFNALQESLPHQLERLNESVTALDARISSLEQTTDRDFHTARNDVSIEIGNLRSEIYQFLTVNIPTKTDLQAVFQITNQPAATPKHVKIKSPPLFSGKLNACEPFFAHLSIVFSADRARFNNDETKILYAISYLTGNAFGYIEPYLPEIDATENKPEILTNYATFKNALVNAFGDSNPIISAESALRNLKQTSSAAAYVSDFRRLSRRTNWNECALVSQFMLNLKDSVKDELSRRDPITDLNTLIKTSIDIDNRLFSRNRQKYAHNREHYPLSNTQSTPASGSVSTSMPMDTSASAILHSKNKTISPELRQYRIDKRLCLYCGANNHYKSQCPKQPTQPNKPTARSPKSDSEFIHTVILE